MSWKDRLNEEWFKDLARGCHVLLQFRGLA